MMSTPHKQTALNSEKPSSPVIMLEDVWVRYNGRDVLENIHLTVRSGEIVSIVGPNGAGKTTLLNVILGFITPYKGRVYVLGRDPKHIIGTGRIGFLPQIHEADRLFPVNAFDVAAMARYAGKRPGGRLDEEDRRIIREALDRVEMGGKANHHFGTLSGGQQQRVLIARALAARPELLILDEPSTGLDAVVQDTFYQLLTRLRDEGLTILIVSHDVGAVSSIVDQIACLNKKIHFHGSPEDCIPPETLERVFGRHTQFLVHDKHCETCRKDR